MDKTILEEYPWSSYVGIPESIKPKLEAALLAELVAQSEGRLNQDYLIGKNCERLISQDDNVRKVLLRCWESGSFEDIRHTGSLQATYSEAGENTSDRPTGLGDIGTVQTMNLYGCNLTEINHNKSGEEDAIKNWLCQVDPGLNHKNLLSAYVEGTGDWFLRSGEFQKWISDDGTQILWCPGEAGVGKTFISSLAFRHLENTTTFPTNILFFDYKMTMSISQILASILRQLYNRALPTTHHIRSLYNHYLTKQSYPSEDELREVVRRTATGIEHIYLILDALDEYSSASESLRLMAVLFDVIPSKRLKLMVTSRYLGQLESGFPALGSTRLDIHSSREDIELFLRVRIQSLSVSLSPEQSKMVVERIRDVSTGRFLLAQLHMSSIYNLDSWGDILDALNRLTDNINFVYEQAIEKIKEQNEQAKKCALKALLWIGCAQRPLTIPEIQQAIAIEPGRENIEDYVYPLDRILKYCFGLVISDSESGTIRFIHQTLQEYFDSETARRAYFAEAEITLLKSCFAYITTFKDFSIDPALIYERCHVSGYISTFWIYLLRKCESTLLPHMTAIDEMRAVLYQALHFTKNLPFGASVASSSSFYPHVLPLLLRTCTSERRLYGLHWAAALNLPHVLNLYIREGASTRTKVAGKKETALTLALRSRAFKTSEILWKHARTSEDWDGADKNALLALASYCGLLDFVDELLSQEGANVNDRYRIHMSKANGSSRPVQDFTPLMYALIEGHLSVVKRLLRHPGLNINAQNSNGDTALHIALRESLAQPALPPLLSYPRIDAKISNKQNMFPFDCFILSGSTHLLFQKYLRDDFFQIRDETVATSAARTFEGFSVIKAILDHEPQELYVSNSWGETPLVAAVAARNWACVYFLLGFDPAIINLKMDHPSGETLLMRISAERDAEVVKCLVQWNADIHVKDHYGRTSITHAVMPKSSANPIHVLQYLLECGAAIDTKDVDGRTPVTVATAECVALPDRDIGGPGVIPDHVMSIVKATWAGIYFLLEHGADLLTPGFDGLTAFDHAKMAKNPWMADQMELYLTDGRTTRCRKT